MSYIALLLIIGLVVVILLLGVLALFHRRGDRINGERHARRQLLMLGIVFLIPGLLNLILYGETSVFLNLGLVFTLSGLISTYLLKTPMFYNAGPQLRTGGLVGLILGGASGAATSVVFSLPSAITILVSAGLGVLSVIALVGVYLRFNQA